MIDQQTSRVNLLPMSVADLENFHSINTDAFVRKYLWDNEIISRDLAGEIHAKTERLFANEGWGLWKMISKADKLFLGYVGLWQFFEEPQPQLLYAVYKQFSGNGYASEAAQKITNYAFSNLGYDHLIASMDIANVSSIKLCQRIGFTLEQDRIIDGKTVRFYRIENNA